MLDSQSGDLIGRSDDLLIFGDFVGVGWEAVPGHCHGTVCNAPSFLLLVDCGFLWPAQRLVPQAGY